MKNGSRDKFTLDRKLDSMLSALYLIGVNIYVKSKREGNAPVLYLSNLNYLNGEQ